MISFLLRHLELRFLITRRDLIITRKSERSTGRQKETKGSVHLLCAAFVVSSIQRQTGSPLCTCPPSESAYLMFTIMWGLPISSTDLLSSSRAEILYLSDSLLSTMVCSKVSVSTEYLTHQRAGGQKQPSPLLFFRAPTSPTDSSILCTQIAS